MDPLLAQTLVAAILDKAPVPLSTTYKTSAGPDVAFGSKAKLNRSKHGHTASQTLKDIAKAMDSQRGIPSTNRTAVNTENQSPIKSNNFIKKNKELGSSSRANKNSAAKADMFVA